MKQDQKVNITLWLLAIRQKLKDTTDEAKRAILKAMYGELLKRLAALED